MSALFSPQGLLSKEYLCLKCFPSDYMLSKEFVTVNLYRSFRIKNLQFKSMALVNVNTIGFKF